MERLTDYKYSTLIKSGYDLISSHIKNRLGYVHFFTGTNPIYAGLFQDGNTEDGRSYKDCWCTIENTIVLPNLHDFGDFNYPHYLKPMLIVHELGHILDNRLGNVYIFSPVTKYAQTNRMESFADAFTLWCCPQYREYYQVINELPDNARYLFESELK